MAIFLARSLPIIGFFAQAHVLGQSIILQTPTICILHKRSALLILLIDSQQKAGYTMFKKLAICAVVSLYFTAGCSGTQKNDSRLSEGTQAPDFQVLDQNGQQVELAELHSKGPLVLTFLRSFF